MDIATLGKIVLAALGVAAAVVLLFVLWFKPVAWVLRGLAPRTLGAPLREGAAMSAVQIALMTMLPAALLWALLGARAPEWAHVAVVAALPWLGLTFGLRMTARDDEGRAWPWPRAALLALPAALTWWLVTAAVLSVPLLLGLFSPPVMLAG
ncbi:hypothetical protein J5226_08950 [Lysobacter sp. K5869]|uniref:hypothetical protein n=1 Tax=Lysobacter sp. K5869 TaxID=2820808 RepID=UPI001C060EDC|nr:hypothetical protein [Lysobacter sp. K5869]QWP78498.1 hypothetical protein J5226_08950 [Lysobacter sp. K5869]